MKLSIIKKWMLKKRHIALYYNQKSHALLPPKRKKNPWWFRFYTIQICLYPDFPPNRKFCRIFFLLQKLCWAENKGSPLKATCVDVSDPAEHWVTHCLGRSVRVHLRLCPRMPPGCWEELLTLLQSSPSLLWGRVALWLQNLGSKVY